MSRVCEINTGKSAPSWAHFLSLRPAQRKETGLSAPIPHKKGAGALFTAGFPLQSLARGVEKGCALLSPELHRTKFRRFLRRAAAGSPVLRRGGRLSRVHTALL
jgi:hypothetical protein